MDKSVYMALSGAVAQERKMEMLTFNLANINTPGFKGERALFEEVLHVAKGAPGTLGYAKTQPPVTDLSEGFPQQTGRKLDLAIKGEGFFVVETPHGERYTRNGTFTTDPDGALTTLEGYKVVGTGGDIRLRSTDVVVDSSGAVTDGGVPVGNLKMATFDRPELLKREGDFFSDQGADVIRTVPGDDTAILQGYLERSNVNAIRAMTQMIEAMRAYEGHAKVIQSVDGMTKRAIDDIGRVA